MSLKFKVKSLKFLLVGIIIVAAFLRLYQIGSVPPSPDWDEAALGYNAYSILSTGKDEYGAFLPFVLQSFDDYKPALYVYTVIPFIPIFGLDILAVRLPSAIFGILTILATYFLVWELFKRRDIALVSSLLLAISPWHIQFSRVGFEANVALAFNVFGVLFFLKGLKQPWLLALSAFFFGLNPSVYQSVRVFTPLLVITLLVIFWKQLFALPKKYLLLSFFAGLLALSPLLTYIASNNNALSRFRGVSILSDYKIIEPEVEKRLEDREIKNSMGAVFHNKTVAYSREIISGYFSHFDLNWLFIHGDLSRHHAPGMGLLYLWELPFLFMGIYLLVFSRFSLQTKLFIFAWLLLVPVPAAITKDVPHAVRTLNFLPVFQIFIALGLLQFLAFIKKNHETRVMNYGIKLFAIGYLFFVLFNFSYFLNQYFVQQNYFASQDWQYGYKEAVSYVQSVENNYKKIVVSNQVPLDQSHMFFLFYLRYPPTVYQQSAHITEENNYFFDKYEFRPINWANEERSSDILYVGRPEDFPIGVSIRKIIHYLNGKPAIVIVEG